MELSQIYEETLDYFLGPVGDLLADESVSEVMVNGHRNIYFERRGRIHRSEASFPSEAALMAAIHNIAEYVGRHIDSERPSMDARLPDGSRVHAIIPPSSRQGPCLTIRKFQTCTSSLDTLVEMGSLSDTAAEFLELAVLLHKNILISGGTGTGKTTMLNALSGAIPVTERILVIEDSSELKLQQEHTIYLESQPPQPNGRGAITIRDLFVESLRMRPDRVIVGEVRRGEALDLVQSMLSGHAGALTTIHANSPHDAVSRLETLCLMSDTSMPIYVTRSQVSSAVHLVLQLTRLSDGSRRVKSIAELRGLDDTHTFQVSPLFEMRCEGTDPEGKIISTLRPTGHTPSFADELAQLGLANRVSLTQSIFESGKES